nr:SapC family protein [uncultured Halomonas sp.]
MSNPLIVSPKTCQGLSWFPPADVAFAAHQPLIPLHAGELANAAATLPLAVVKEGSAWRMVGVCGLANDQNLFIREGKWLGAYRPHWLSTWPLDIVEMGDKGVVVFDRDSGLLGSGDDHGEAFFNAEGQPSGTLAGMLDSLKANFAKRRATHKALAALNTAGVLVPWPESIGQPLGLSIEGLHMVDEKALANLPDDTFLSLRCTQALPIAYALNLSLAQTHLLSRLARVNTHPGDAPENLDEVFGEDDDLTFDFDS